MYSMHSALLLTNKRKILPFAVSFLEKEKDSLFNESEQDNLENLTNIKNQGKKRDKVKLKTNNGILTRTQVRE